ncbi:MAG: hypothetical protein JO149_05130 [Gammaproteobacteria bacterium]|nr:hypothetical protein [Gammaproteobacteria bacterium]
MKTSKYVANSTVVVRRILTSKAQHEGRVRAIVKMRLTTTAEFAAIYAISLLMLALLFMCPGISYGVVPTSSTDTSLFVPNIANTNIQCKRVTIDSTTRTYQTAFMNATIPTCPAGTVPIGVNTGTLGGSGISTAGTFVVDSNGTLPVNVYTFDPLNYYQNTTSLNYISIICAPKTMAFSGGAC